MSSSAARPTYGPPPPPPPPGQHRRRTGGVVGPLLLIFIGSVFLLQNTGYLPPNFWVNLWRLWPVVLVLAGIELLLAQRAPRLVLAALVAVVLVVGAAVIHSGVPNAPRAASVTRAVQTELGNATQASVIVHFGAGQLDVGPLDQAAAATLASMTYDGPADLAPEPHYTVGRGGVGQLEYDTSGKRISFGAFFGGNADTSRTRLDLNPRVPITTMTVQTGAADTRLDLSSLQVSNLDMSLGAASTWVRLPQMAGTTSTVHVSGGAATITLEVPQGVAASIRHRGGLSTVTVDTTRFPRVGEGVYRSPDYESATSRVDVTLETGVTTIQVN